MSVTEKLQSMVGSELGTGDWFEIDQDRINAFADATNDQQWIHVDPEMAKAGPFGTTIAHGYLTLSLIPFLGQSAGDLPLDGIKMGINYGLNRVRFINPVKVGSKVRSKRVLKEVTPVDGGVQVTVEVTVEIDGEAKPACVADTLARLYF